jgi:hypothetical protein
MKNYSKKMEWNTKKQKKWKLRLKGDKIKLRVWKYFQTDNLME